MPHGGNEYSYPGQNWFVMVIKDIWWEILEVKITFCEKNFGGMVWGFIEDPSYSSETSQCVNDPTFQCQ